MAISQHTTKTWTTAALLDFDGYKGYNVSIIAAGPTATTYFLECIPQYSDDYNNDGMTVNITAIQGPSTAGMIIIDTRASASYEYRCPVTDFSISFCTYLASSILPSGSSDTQGLGSGVEGETVIAGPTTFTDATVITDGVTEITTVVVYVTGGVEKLATLSGSDATVTGNTSGFGGSGSSSSRATTGAPSASLTQAPETSSVTQSVATQSPTLSSSQGVGQVASIGNGAVFGGLVGLLIAAF